MKVHQSLAHYPSASKRLLQSPLRDRKRIPHPALYYISHELEKTVGHIVVDFSNEVRVFAKFRPVDAVNNPSHRRTVIIKLPELPMYGTQC